MGKLIWLASYPKSGNTWLRAFLHNLMRNPNEPYDINRLTDFTLSDAQMRWYQTWSTSARARRSRRKRSPPCDRRMHEAMTRAHPDTIFVKTHNALVEDRGTPMITMEYTAGAIYVIRNPLDVVISYADHYGLTLDAAIACHGDARAAVGERGDPLLRALWLLVRACHELDASSRRRACISFAMRTC